MRRANAFTVVELLVVIAIVSVLAAMLLPAVELSVEQAWRVRCLNERMTNGLSLSMFATDHRDLLPHPVYNWNTGNRTMHTQIPWTEPHGVLYASTKTTPLGTLAAFGYVADPGALVCSSLARKGTWRFADAEASAAWTALTTQQNAISEGMAIGITDFFLMCGPWPNSERWAKGYTRPNLKITDIARSWQADQSVAPALVSCMNYSSWPWIRQTEEDGRGVIAAGGANWGAEPDGAFVSHRQQGVNALMFDMSCRWVDRREVRWMSGFSGYLMYNTDRVLSNFQGWAQQCMELNAPRQ